MNPFARAWNAIFGGFKNVFSFLLPILKSAAGDVINESLPVALEIVKSLATSGMAPDVKRDEAVKRLEDYLVMKGQTVSTSVMNLVVEMAVNKLKVE